LAGVYLFAFVLVAWLVFRIKNPVTLQSALVTVGCVLVGFSIIQLAGYKLYSNNQTLTATPVNLSSDADDNGGSVDSQNLPDIYWILLDGHTRGYFAGELFS
jgi:hypothetical protein